MLHVTIIFIKTENIVIDWNWGNYLLKSSSPLSYIFLYKIIMHAWRMSYYIVAIYIYNTEKN